MVLLMVPIIFRSLLGFFQNEEIGCEDTGFTKKKKKRKKEKDTHPGDISHSVDGNFLLAVQPFPVLDGPAVQKTNTHMHITNRVQ